MKAIAIAIDAHRVKIPIGEANNLINLAKEISGLPPDLVFIGEIQNNPNSGDLANDSN
jgi:hypothetical protein